MKIAYFHALFGRGNIALDRQVFVVSLSGNIIFAMSPEVGCFLKPHDKVLYEFARSTVGHLQFSKENNGKHPNILNVE